MLGMSLSAAITPLSSNTCPAAWMLASCASPSAGELRSAEQEACRRRHQQMRAGGCRGLLPAQRRLSNCAGAATEP